MQLVANAAPSSSDVMDQASAWVTRLSSDRVNENDLQAFSLWLAQNEEHKAAFDEMLDVWQDLGVVKHLPIEIPKSVTTTDFTDTAEEVTNTTEQNASTRSNRVPKWVAMGAIAASVVLTAIIMPIINTDPEPDYFSTEIGQRQTIYLDDGSSVTLNTDTHLKVTLTKHQRSIHLHSGEAFFDVAKDPERPFVVNSCASEVRALGTAFNIRCNREQGEVTVTEGVVQVTGTSSGQTDQTPTRLEKDQTININSSADISPPKTVDSQHVINWRKGQLIFENTPLIEVIKEANRYSTTQISLGTPQLAHLLVSGRFDSTDTQTLLAALQYSLALETVVQNDNNVILNKAE